MLPAGTGLTGVIMSSRVKVLKVMATGNVFVVVNEVFAKGNIHCITNRKAISLISGKIMLGQGQGTDKPVIT